MLFFQHDINSLFFFVTLHYIPLSVVLLVSEGCNDFQPWLSFAECYAITSLCSENTVDDKIKSGADLVRSTHLSQFYLSLYKWLLVFHDCVIFPNNFSEFVSKDSLEADTRKLCFDCQFQENICVSPIYIVSNSYQCHSINIVLPPQ